MFKPVGNLVVLEETEASDKSGSIILADQSKETLTAKVVMTGPGKVTKTGKILGMDVSPGDTVIYEKDKAIETIIDDEKVLIIDHDYIHGVISLDNSGLIQQAHQTIKPS